MDTTQRPLGWPDRTENIGLVNELPLLVVGSPETSRSTRSLSLAMVFSLCLHLAGAAWASWVWIDESPTLLPVARGRASLALTARMPQAAAQVKTFPTVELPGELPPAAMPQALRPMPDHVARRRLQPELSTRTSAVLPRPALPRTHPTLDQRLNHQQTDHASDQQRPATPRPDGQRHGEAKLSATAAQASLASAASRGTDSQELPRIVENLAPEYPATALAAGQTGRVLIRVSIAPSGYVLDVQLHRSSGFASLDRSAILAVRQWRFSPSTSSDAGPRRVIVPVDFLLRE